MVFGSCFSLGNKSRNEPVKLTPRSLWIRAIRRSSHSALLCSDARLLDTDGGVPVITPLHTDLTSSFHTSPCGIGRKSASSTGHNVCIVAGGERHRNTQENRCAQVGACGKFNKLRVRPVGPFPSPSPSRQPNSLPLRLRVSSRVSFRVAYLLSMGRTDPPTFSFVKRYGDVTSSGGDCCRSLIRSAAGTIAE
ncbi:Hypothetical protein NTJ_02319 [Nesidiocoris tenuis]|uniref:Uncharacterized protein n=1 Tax=Nesidiocoris tenuis TaxID=355587 RepID=A0ABN7AGN9_9HEMI|nr:Hypothetical protein NTJ_02319 [Nesidiocoris tenuis]